MTERELVEGILDREGGFVDDPADRGGPTNFGITLHTLARWRGRSVTRDEVEALTRDEAGRIYLRLFIDAPGFREITNESLRALVADFYVNSGATAIEALQRALDVPVDGVLGPRTLAALRARESAEVYRRVWRARLELYLRLALDEPRTKAYLEDHRDVQLRNLRGWLRRLAGFV